MTTSRLLLATAACIALAAASLLLADEPVYDVWAWLVWGRELADLGLSARTGPSWKPLPVMLAAPLSLAGDAAPAVWLVLVRAAWLASLVLAADLAFQLAAGASRGARIVGAAFAAIGVVLLSDEVMQVSRQVAGGMSEPLLVALVLGAARAAFAARRCVALGLIALAALLRPEAWPLLAVCGLWCWRTDRRARPFVALVALVVPVLWFAPELLVAGRASASRAQTGTSNPAESLEWAAMLPLTVAWPLALATLQDRRARLLAAGALAWIGIVAAMTVAGFAGLPRFVAPAAAVVCALGGAGLAALATRPRAALLALVAPALVVTALGLRDRIDEVPHAWRSSARVDRSHERLGELVHAVGRTRLLACGRLATSDVLVRTALAWELDVPLSRVVSFGERPRLSGAFIVGPQASPQLRVGMRTAATLVAQRREWSLYALRCPATVRPAA